MLEVIPSPERTQLGFPEAVVDAFDFLVQDYGFRCIKSDMTFVRFESSAVFVNVYHGRASYEIGVEIGLINDPLAQIESPLTLRDIVEFNGAENQIGYTRVVTFSAYNPELVRKFVNKLADFVKVYAEPELKGDRVVFDQLRAFRSRQAADEERERRLSRIRREADKAWRDKDYSSVISLFEKMETYLTPAEAKKLEYAKKHYRT